MKDLLLTGFFILLSTPLFSQEYDLGGMQGLRNRKGEVMLELSGYEIFITTAKGQVNNKKTINSIKKKYGMETILAEFSEPGFSKTNKIIESESKVKGRPKVKLNQVFYIFNKSDREVEVVSFRTLNQRDVVLEEEVIKMYLKNGLDHCILDEQTANSLSFAGREIDLGSACRWTSPHNVNCKGGQMSWSEFPSFESANLDINTRIDANMHENINVLAEDDIDILFEGIPSLAHRVVYKQKPGAGQSTKPLIVYYVVQEVRGRYVSCVLGNYGYGRNDYELAPLLQEVMSIPVLPEAAYNQFDIPQYEEDTGKRKEYFDYYMEIHAGSWLPLGNLRNAYKAAPSVGAYIGYPIKKEMAIDFGFRIAFPVNRQLFDYYHSGWTEVAKARFIGNINLRFRYQQAVAKNIYWTTYAGAGVISVQTDLEKEYYYDDNDKWYSFETLDVFGGVNIRYKRAGLYLEYHYTPFSITNKVRKDYGNSALNLGAAVYF
ncbi:MAG: hypothetical protein LBR26_12105 [Prevotella sp.]|jgi:hypothetical protein|nr:hypothetical protein [Prevotella sp.]